MQDKWKIYPPGTLEKVARKHGYEIGEFLYLIAADELPRDVKADLETILRQDQKKFNGLGE